ncbi:MAG: hypothetical protein IJ228_07540 [Succinivibrio sp.]|nr:hypothetical protein [Succinivibrio sp.]
MEFEQVKKEFRARKKELDENFRIRLHRAISWMDQAREEGADLRFVTLWIAFNAFYAQRLGNQYGDSGDRATLRDFLDKICRLDKEHLIYDVLWKEYSGNLRALLDCPWIFREYWDYQAGRCTLAAFQEDFDKAKSKTKTDLERGNTNSILATVFDRLYTLRNQIIHGGATCNGKANRKQLRFGADLLACLNLVIIKIMLDSYPQEQWGELYYPYVKDNDF